LTFFVIFLPEDGHNVSPKHAAG